MPQPTAETLEKRKTVGIKAETVTDVTSKDFPGHYPGEDHAWDLQHFHQTNTAANIKKLNIDFHRNEANEAIFSLVGVDASIANAFRRILLASLPTLAIETVYIEQNTSIIQDEVLSQRLGLVPLKGSKQGLRWLKWRRKGTAEDPGLEDKAADYNTIQMRLNVECTWKEGGQEKFRRGETDPEVLYNNAHVYARQLVYDPIGQQASTYFTPEAGPVEIVHPDILLAKLRPGQSISAQLHAVLGIGSDHAKFSPVATATYRLLPSINIMEPIVGADAVKFQQCFPKGVIELEAITASESKKKDGPLAGKQGEKKAVVSNPFRDTVTRECLRHEEFQGKVKLGRVRDHFIFSIESTGQWNSDELMVDAIKCLRMKCKRVKRDFARLREAGV